MWRGAEVVGRPLLALCGLLLLAGCATTKLSREPLARAEQEAFLRGMPGFRLEGRVAVTVGEERDMYSLGWRQQAAESRLRFSPPVGFGNLTLVHRPQFLHVTTSRGDDLRDVEAEQVLLSQLGFLPPFESLRHWVIGLPAPAETPTGLQRDADGRILDMRQQQWQIQYDSWMEVATVAGLVQLPRRLTATRGDLHLRLFVDRWDLRAD